MPRSPTRLGGRGDVAASVGKRVLVKGAGERKKVLLGCGEESEVCG